MSVKLIHEMLVVSARDLDEAWNLGVRGIMDYGYVYTVAKGGSHEGQQRRELDSFALQIRYPGTLPLVPIVPDGVPPPCTADYVHDYLPYLLCGVKQGNEDYTYGMDIEKQLPKFIEILKEGGDGTNQACMSIGDPNTSIWLESPQCLRVIDARIRRDRLGYRDDGPVYSEPKLHFHVYFRSWDMWSGFPANLAAIQILKESVSLELGVKDGPLFAYSKGLHLYDHHWGVANMVLRR